MKIPSLMLLLIPVAAAVQAAPHSSAPPRVLDLRPPNFFSAQWQDRLQGLAVENSNETPEAIVITPLPEQEPNVHLSRSGIGSLFWAAFHPTQAWRVLLPVQPGDDFDVYSDVRLHCATYAATPVQQSACAVPM